MTSSTRDDSFFGPAAPELGWVPAPRYLMRRARVLRLLATIKPGLLLEVGPGAGAFLIEATRREWKCEALETSIQARALAESMTNRSGLSIPLHSTPGKTWRERFDLLCSFEVLEHIEDDREALTDWHSWLKPGGVLLLSVPAHQRMWTAGDEWAGHFRRYERKSFLKLLGDVGFKVENFECYGFPLTNLTERISARAYARRLQARSDSNGNDRRLNTDQSGIDRGPHLKVFPILNSLPGKCALSFFLAVQAMFTRTNLGSGFLLKATRL